MESNRIGFWFVWVGGRGCAVFLKLIRKMVGSYFNGTSSGEQHVDYVRLFKISCKNTNPNLIF